jgi:hypothetical protein
VEFVENRRDWGAYLEANNLAIPELLKDAVHQSDYGRDIINANRPEQLSYEPTARERRVKLAAGQTAPYKILFTGNRIDMVGRMAATGGTLKVLIDGQPADKVDAFLMTYVEPNKNNVHVNRGDVPRDQAPHGITLGKNVVPQSWTITMTSDSGDYALVGSVTGPDGAGNAFKPFTSTSGQIAIEPELWRRAEKNRTGDTFTFEVYRAVASDFSFRGTPEERFTVRLAQVLPNGEHTLELISTVEGDTPIDAFEIFQPPEK